MKAAYLAYDSNSLVTLSVLSNYFEQIDFYLFDKVRQENIIDFKQIPILIDHVVIPADLNLRTETHKNIFKSIEDEFLFYKNELSTDYRQVASTYTEVQKTCQTEIAAISTVKDIVYSTKTSDVFIEKDTVGISNYKFLFVEDHQIVSENFNRFAKNIFSVTPQNSHVWFTLEYDYELKKPREYHLKTNHFILVKDRLNHSILDNWYFVRTFDNKITVQQWVPFNQFKNSDFQKFMIERVIRLLKEKLDLIQITKFNQYYVNATPGFSAHKTSLKNNKLSCLMPSFNFWSKDEINNYLYLKLDKKMKELNKPQTPNLNIRG
jgi:hypothetical protein